MRTAVFGAGGIGGYVGGRLVEAGEDVTFIARGENLAVLRREGLRIQSPFGNADLPSIQATDNPPALGPVDVVVVTTKLWDLDAAGKAISPLLSAGGLAVVLQNGIDAAEILARWVPRAQVVNGVIYVSAHLEGPGVIHESGGQNHMVLESLNGDPRLVALANACQRCVALGCSLSDLAIDDFLWSKYISLCAFSGSTALLRSPIGAIRDNPETAAFLKSLVHETAAIARTLKRAVPTDIEDRVLKIIGSWPAGATSSMSVDLAHGRRLELPWLSSRVHTFGRELGVPTPAHSAVHVGLVLHQMGSGA